MKLTNSEAKVMEVLWENGPMKAADITRIISKKLKWKRNTTYTVIQRAVEKGVITRSDPDFVCSAILSKEKYAEERTNDLVESVFDGSYDRFLVALAKNELLKEDTAENLLHFIKKNK